MNCEHLQRYNKDLYSQLVRYPQELIPIFDMAANEVFFKEHPDAGLEHQIQVGVASGCGQAVRCSLRSTLMQAWSTRYRWVWLVGVVRL